LKDVPIVIIVTKSLDLSREKRGIDKRLRRMESQVERLKERKDDKVSVVVTLDG
jgi:hypothetical protein